MVLAHCATALQKTLVVQFFASFPSKVAVIRAEMASNEDLDQRFGIVNERTPANAYLSAHFKQSLAYYTMSERLPRIITEVIDHLSRSKDALESGKVAREEIKHVIGKVSQLKYELQTNKELTPFEGTSDELEVWNSLLQSMSEETEKLSYFSVPWLYSECYLYRRLKLIFESTETLKDYDYFKEQKDNTLTSCLPTIRAVAAYLEANQVIPDEAKQETLIKLLKLNLWGNRVDLSVSGGQEIKLVDDPFEKIRELDASILVNDAERVWQTLQPLDGKAHVEFINDNAGYELFVDLVLADFLLDAGLAKTISFNLKAMPWFVSDALEHDVWSLLTFLRADDFQALQRLSDKWRDRFAKKDFQLAKAEPFWTTGYEFPKMKRVDPNLYNRLSKADLLVFKGDLNYRKLLSDQNWDPTTGFKESLKDFHPTSLVSLRTVKADVISGLPPGKAQELERLNPKWMKDGDYGVIQFA